MKLKSMTHIPKEVRDKVYERDSWDGRACCIYCGKPYVEIHHYIERSRGGLGVEQNLVCLCGECHKRVHNGSRIVHEFIRTYLTEKYEGWDEDTLIAKKGH